MCGPAYDDLSPVADRTNKRTNYCETEGYHSGSLEMQFSAWVSSSLGQKSGFYAMIQVLAGNAYQFTFGLVILS